MNKSQGFYKLVLMFNRVYKLLHLNQRGWRKKLLFKSYRALNSAMHDFSEVSNSLSLPRQVERDCWWPAEPEETEIIYGLSSSSFCRSVAEQSAQASQDQQFWVCYEHLLQSATGEIAEKVSQRRLENIK